MASARAWGTGQRGRLPGVLIAAGLSLLLASWVAATPPFGAPDEQSHYLRALTITNGSLLGPKVRYSIPVRTPEPAWQKEEIAWADVDTRATRVPPRLSPPLVGCMSGRPDIAAGGCLEATPTGDYPPLAYLLPALALRSAPDATTGDWWGRVASALPVLAFLLIALALVDPLGPWPRLGMLAAVSPMVLFVGAVLNSSGLVIAASLACAAAAVRIAAAPRAASRSVLVALALSGSVAILAWQLGPWFVLLALAFATALAWPERRAILADHRRGLVWSALALAAALALYVVYAQVSGVTHGSLEFDSLGTRLHDGVHQLIVGVLPDVVGRFGWRTVSLPHPAYWLWWIGTLALVATALWVSRWRDRLVLTASVVLALAFPVLLYALIYRQSGFGLQGRQVLPVFLFVPLLAGQAIQRSAGRGRAPAPWLAATGLAAIAAFQLSAWWVNARASAGEPHAFWFLAHPAWSPPLGWWPWAALALAGSAALAAGAVAEPTRRPAWRVAR